MGRWHEKQPPRDAVYGGAKTRKNRKLFRRLAPHDDSIVPSNPSNPDQPLSDNKTTEIFRKPRR